MNIIVQKFGGTSVSSVENRKKVIDKILNKKKKGYDIVVVVSAIGRDGDPYATDTFKNLINPKITNKKELDLLISCGEVISSIVLSNELREEGYETEVLTGKDIGIITDDNFGDARILDFDRTNIENSLRKNKIVIVAGFQGATIDGDITTLGRGGSDISAAVIGGYLKADCVEIFTDVDGIMTADPKIVKNAKVIDRMRYLEVSQLAEDGAKVIHPRAVEFAERFDVPLIIKNTHSNSIGTYIEDANGEFIVDKTGLESKKIMTAITYKKDRLQVCLKLEDEAIMNKILVNFVRENISLDLINFFEVDKVFTVDEEDKEKVAKILNKYEVNYKMIESCCKISCIGYKMRGIPGVMANIYEALTSKDIDILQTSDSHTTIWCLIKEKDLEVAIESLHTRFKLYE